jgi:hypothetical protein
MEKKEKKHRVDNNRIRNTKLIYNILTSGIFDNRELYSAYGFTKQGYSSVLNRIEGGTILYPSTIKRWKNALRNLGIAVDEWGS